MRAEHVCACVKTKSQVGMVGEGVNDTAQRRNALAGSAV